MRRPGSPGEGAAGSAILLPDAVDDPALADTRDDRFARQRALPQQHLRRRSRGQIAVDPAAETAQPDALPGVERAAHADEGHDAPPAEARDLGDTTAPDTGALADTQRES